MRTFKGMSGPPTSRSIRTAETNVGSPVGREPYGDIVPVVVAGVVTCQGGREGRSQGEGAQVIGHQHDREVGAMLNAEPVLGVLRVAAIRVDAALVTGEPRCATRRSAVSPAQRGEIGGDISGSDGLPDLERG